MGIVSLILCIVFPGFGQIVTGLLVKPTDMDSIVCGIIMIIAYVLITVIASILSVIVIGVVLYIFLPVIWGWSIYWGVRAYQISTGAEPLSFHTAIPVIGAMGGDAK